MSDMTAERRKVVVLCTMVACMASGPALLRNHPVLVWIWIAVMLVLLGFAGAQFAKIKKQQQKENR